MARYIFLMARWSLLAVVLAIALAPRPAAADEIAPELETLELRQKAQAEMRRAFGALAENDRRRLVGTYLAIDPSPSEPIAQAACDDDGDYVVVVSDAMLRLASNVARAQSYDEAETNGRHVEDYASYLGRVQNPGRRLLPPSPGFYSGKPAPTADERLREALAFVVARELAVLRAGDLVCPHPTATKEHGDDEWTPAEQKKAREIAERIYPNTNGARARDEEAFATTEGAGRALEGAIGLLRFFAQLEITRSLSLGLFVPAYHTTHPGPAVRLMAARAAAARRQAP